MAIFRDWRIDLQTGDRYISPAGDYEIVTDAECVQQWLWARFRILFGEWFLNRQFGFKARELLLNRGAPPGALEAHVRRLILTTTGVTGLLEPTFETDRTLRQFSVDGRITWVGGAFDMAALASPSISPGGFAIVFGAS